MRKVIWRFIIGFRLRSILFNPTYRQELWRVMMEKP